MEPNKWLKLLIALLACVFIAPLEVQAGQVSITLQSLVLFVVAAYVGPKWGGMIILTYLILGGIGIPVFADYQSGMHKLSGPTSGFLWGFLLAGIFLGWRCRNGMQNYFHYGLYLFQAHVILLIPGFIILDIQIEGLNILDTLVKLLPGLLIKTVVGSLIAFSLVKYLPFDDRAESSPI